MKRFFLILVLIFSTFSLHAAEKSAITDVTYNSEKNIYTCTCNSLSRTFILCLPEQYNSTTSLILMLHGLGGSAASFMNETQMDVTANVRNYAVVYVDGTVDPKNKSHGKGWHFYQDDFSKKDVEFLVELAKYCREQYGLGPRVFAVGFSNGGFMVNKLATAGGVGFVGFDKLNQRKKRDEMFFTGVASVGGMMPKDVWDSKKAKKPVGYLQINGTKDDVVPMEFMGTAKQSPNPAMEKVVEYYAGVNKVSKKYKEVQLSDVATLRNYSSKVGWIIIQDGRHNWPSSDYSGIDVDSVILDFFDAL